MDKSIVRIRCPEKHEIQKFIGSAGSSLKTFRYFEKRSIDCINCHIVTFLYVDGKEYLGYGHLDKDIQDIWLGICVSENYLGKGLGKQIMSDLITEGEKLGIENIRLTVDSDNLAAVKLYDNVGFVREKISGNTLYMRLNLQKHR